MIAIKGMDMPACCDDCWALEDIGDYPFCLITQQTRGYNFRTREKRMDNCPLIELDRKLEHEINVYQYERELEKEEI